MKPDYKKWMPKGMIYAGLSATLILFILFIVFGLTGILSGTIKTVVFIFFLIGTVVGVCASLWMILMYRAFDYNGKRKMSKQIIDGIADYVDMPDDGKCLDVGCGSGALTIACAKRNPDSSFIGVDRCGRNTPHSINRCVSATPKRKVWRIRPFSEVTRRSSHLRTRALMLFAVITFITISRATDRHICSRPFAP